MHVFFSHWVCGAALCCRRRLCRWDIPSRSRNCFCSQRRRRELSLSAKCRRWCHRRWKGWMKSVKKICPKLPRRHPMQDSWLRRKGGGGNRHNEIWRRLWHLCLMRLWPRLSRWMVGTRFLHSCSTMQHQLNLKHLKKHLKIGDKMVLGKGLRKAPKKLPRKVLRTLQPKQEGTPWWKQARIWLWMTLIASTPLSWMSWKSRFRPKPSGFRHWNEISWFLRKKTRTPKKKKAYHIHLTHPSRKSRNQKDEQGERVPKVRTEIPWNPWKWLKGLVSLLKPCWWPLPPHLWSHEPRVRPLGRLLWIRRPRNRQQKMPRHWKSWWAWLVPPARLPDLTPSLPSPNLLLLAVLVSHIRPFWSQPRLSWRLSLTGRFTNTQTQSR